MRFNRITDIPFPVSATCANTADMGTQRAVVEIQQLQINDGGTDGSVATTADNTLFGVQGIFIP
jgi:hypothetical protein